MAKPKVNSKKLDEYEKYLRELWTFAKKLESMFKELSLQERVLAGGTIFQCDNPWGNLRMSMLTGDRETIANLLNRTLQDFNRSRPEPPPIFGKEKDKPIN